MSDTISFCGLDCGECGAFLATRDNDDQKRAEVAELWSKEYKADLKPEDINCEGCLAEGENIFNYCKICEIRECGKEKGIENCAHCSDYPKHHPWKFLFSGKIPLHTVHRVHFPH